MMTKPDKGLVFSASAHGALLLLALVGFSTAPKFEEAQESTPVDMISDAKFAEIMKGEKSAKETKPATKAVKKAEIAETKPDAPVNPVAKEVPLPPPPLKRLVDPVEEDKPEPPPPVKVVVVPPKVEPPAPPTPPVRPPEPVKPPPPAPKVEAKPPPPDKPEAEVITPAPPPKPAPPKPTPPKPAPPKVAEVTPPKPVPPTPPAPPQKPVLDQVAALLNHAKPDSTATTLSDATDKPKHTRPVAPPAPSRPFDPNAINNLLQTNASVNKVSTAHEPTQTASIGAPNAHAAKMSVTMGAEFDQLLKDHYNACWDKGAIQGIVSYKPSINVHFRQNGSLIGEPELTNRPGDAQGRSIADSAIRAIRTCGPVPIPARLLSHYEEWKDTTLIMNPNDS